MNRTNICKNIVQSIKDYITDQVKLEPHRVEKHFVRRRKLSLLQVIIYLFFSSKASMFQNLSQIREELGTLSFPLNVETEKLSLWSRMKDVGFSEEECVKILNSLWGRYVLMILINQKYENKK